MQRISPLDPKLRHDAFCGHHLPRFCKKYTPFGAKGRQVSNVKFDVGVRFAAFALVTVQPGWVWSECIKPVAGTDSCQAHHLGVVQSGQLLVQHEDGSEATLNPGDVYECKPGHQAQVVGDEPCVMIEFDNQTAETYAKD